MKPISFHRAFLVAMALAWLMPPEAAHAADCAELSTPITVGTYGSPCPLVPGYLFSGRIVGGPDCEFRGFLVFDVPASSSPYVSGELRAQLLAVEGPNESETFELHPVVTSLNALTNNLGSSLATFLDLADGVLLGSRVFPLRSSSAPVLAPDIQVSIPLTKAGLVHMNEARGKRLAIGTSIANPDEQPPRVMGSVRFLDRLNGFTLVLKRSEDSAPQVSVSAPAIPALAGGSSSFSAVSCGKEPLVSQWFKDGVALLGETNGILSFDPVLPVHAGNYTFYVSNQLGVATSSPIDFKVSPVSIVAQPTGFSTFDSSSGSCLSVGFLSFLPLRYDWRRNGESIKRAAIPYLCFEPILLSDSGNYDVVLSNDYGSVTSAVAVVKVNPLPPSFDGYPVGTLTGVAGLPFELSSHALGTEPISYQWFKNSAPIAGEVSNRLLFSPALLSDIGSYHVVAANAYGSITSQVARLLVVPALFLGPVDVSGPIGSRVMLWSRPSSIPDTTFQWYHNGKRAEGETEPFLVREPVAASDLGSYFVVANNGYGSSTSLVAQLILETYPPSATIYSSDSLPALVGNDLVLGVSVSGGPLPTLQWKRNGLALPGATNESLIFRSVSQADAGLYTVEVVNSQGSALSSGVQVDVVARSPQFDLVPVDSAEVVGSLVTLRSHALGAPLPSYQWRKGGADLPGATNATLILPRTTAGDAGSYEVVARNSQGEARYAFALTLRPSTQLDRWDWSLPRPQGSRLLDIAWGDGRFVAVGKAGNIVTSTDGIQWDRAIIEMDCDLTSVAYGQGHFVAIGMARVFTGYPTPDGVSLNSVYSGLVLTSTDGLTWTPRQSPSPFPLDIAFGNGVFVLTGAPDDATTVFNYTSTDGVSWIPQYNDWSRSARVMFANGEFWASDQGFLYRSSDGAAWRPGVRSLLGEPTGFLAYGDGQYIALGAYGQFGQSSSDGVSWTPFALTNQGVQSLAFGNGRYVGALYYNESGVSSATGSSAGSIITSEDGRSWTQRETGTRQELESVIFANDRFWAVGEAGTITSSTNGIHWSPSLAANATDYYGLTRKGDLVLAAGDDGTILTSVDGQAWTRQVTSSGRNLHCVHQAAGLVVAGGRGGRIMTSPDAIRWTTRASGTTNYVERLGWGDGRWVGACEDGDIITSPNGVDWSVVRTDPPSDHEGVAYGGGYWMVAGGYFRRGPTAGDAVSTLFVSTNAVDWQLLNVDLGVRLRDIAFGNGKFVAAGNDGRVVVLSPTGDPARPFQVETSYQIQQSVPFGGGYVNFRRVQFSNGTFVIVGNNGVMVSSRDLSQNWVNHRSRTSQNLHDILFAEDGSFYAVGNNGMILRSGVPEPHFTDIRPTALGVRLEFTSPVSAGPLRLEESEDMALWRLVADPATSPLELPTAKSGARYFRLLTR